ncbi:MAG TPA: hypothetical protein DCP68_09980 [Ruminococcus sp.]|nr:hypothetical protein [Ruminococcus sp.]
MKLNRPSLIALLFFVIWEALYMSILYILERRFPDAAFFAQDTTAPFWVGLGGAALSIAGGELFRKWLQNRLSDRSFRRLELGLCVLFIAALLILYHFFAPDFLRIF